MLMDTEIKTRLIRVLVAKNNVAWTALRTVSMVLVVSHNLEMETRLVDALHSTEVTDVQLKMLVPSPGWS